MVDNPLYQKQSPSDGLMIHNPVYRESSPRNAIGSAASTRGPQQAPDVQALYATVAQDKDSYAQLPSDGLIDNPVYRAYSPRGGTGSAASTTWPQHATDAQTTEKATPTQKGPDYAQLMTGHQVYAAAGSAAAGSNTSPLRLAQSRTGNARATAGQPHLAAAYATLSGAHEIYAETST